MTAVSLAARDGRFEVGGIPAFLLADTAWSALSDARDDEWRHYLRRRAEQGFNAAFVSVLPILHDRSVRAVGGPVPFDEDLVRREGRWELNPRFFDHVRLRLEQAAADGIVCGLVLLWVNYADGSWGSRRTPGFVMPEEVQRQYLTALGRAVPDTGALLVVSGDAGFAAEAEIGAYATFTRLVRRTWPRGVLAYHLAPDAVLPPELDRHAGALIFQSGHYGDRPALARSLARYYRAIAAGRPVMNAEPCYEGHRIGGGVGRFGRSAVRRQIWESVVAGASAGVSYGAHGLWGWHRDGDEFSSAHFSGTPLDWRDALSLPGAGDAAACRALVEQEGLSRLADPGERLRVAGQDWGADQVVIGLDEKSGTAAVYLPHGGPVELRYQGSLSLRRVIDLEANRGTGAACTRSGADGWVIDPPATTAEALVILDAG